MKYGIIHKPLGFPPPPVRCPCRGKLLPGTGYPWFARWNGIVCARRLLLNKVIKENIFLLFHLYIYNLIINIVYNKCNYVAKNDDWIIATMLQRLPPLIFFPFLLSFTLLKSLFHITLHFSIAWILQDSFILSGYLRKYTHANIFS